MQTVIGTRLLCSQDPPLCQSKSSAVWGLGLKVPQKTSQKPDLPRLSPRDRALAVFVLLGSWGRSDAVLN
jgi:hypothetical protein